MNGSLATRLRDFTALLLERRGAAVEWHPEAGEGYAVLPPDLAKLLGGWELLRLSFQPDSEGLPVNLATDFLERVQPMVDREPQVGTYRVPDTYLKQGRLEELIGRTFTWQNARVKMQGAAPTHCEYHVWSLFASLHSEDRFEDCFSIALNTKSGAEVALPDMFDSEVRPWHEASPAPDTWEQAKRRALAHVEKASATFVERMESRLARDRNRLHGYYSALLKEKRKAADASSAADSPAMPNAVELELKRKLQELNERYILRIDLTPILLLRLNLPALAISCEVSRRQARRIHTLFWNPVMGALEPLSCFKCTAPVFSVAFSDDHVEPLCRNCS